MGMLQWLRSRIYELEECILRDGNGIIGPQHCYKDICAVISALFDEILRMRAAIMLGRDSDLAPYMQWLRPSRSSIARTCPERVPPQTQPGLSPRASSRR